MCHMATRSFSLEGLGGKGPVQRARDTARVLGIKRLPSSELELAEMVSRGLPIAALASLSGSLGWSRTKLFSQLGVAPRTAARRLQRGALLTVPESDRLLRVARIFARATDVLESMGSAGRWLIEPCAALAGRKPLDLLATDLGTELVLNELGKIDQGFFA